MSLIITSGPPVCVKRVKTELYLSLFQFSVLLQPLFCYPVNKDTSLAEQSHLE